MDEILRKRIEDFASEYAERMYKNSTDGERRAAKHDVIKGAEFILCRQWISVDEALPDDWEYVLVMHKPMSGAKNKISIAYLHPTVHSKTWNVEGIECYLNKTNPDDNIVYAWMHIPEVK